MVEVNIINSSDRPMVISFLNNVDDVVKHYENIDVTEFSMDVLKSGLLKLGDVFPRSDVSLFYNNDIDFSVVKSRFQKYSNMRTTKFERSQIMTVIKDSMICFYDIRSTRVISCTIMKDGVEVAKGLNDLSEIEKLLVRTLLN